MPRILVVEEDADIMMLIGEAFAGAPWQVIPCRHEENLLARLQNEQPDAVLLDTRLDGPYTGWELLRRIKDHPRTRNVPIIVCTGSVVLVEQQTSWLAARDIPLLKKPFDLDELETVVGLTMRHALGMAG
jgi:CheY-like chemotaxis protein